MARRTTFTVPSWDDDDEDDVRKLRGAERDGYYSRREAPGATYQIEQSEQRQGGEPRPHGVPPEFDRPSLVDLLPAAPRTLSVSQDIEHGLEQGRDESFWLGVEQAGDLGELHAFAGLGPEVGLRPWVFRDRRIAGRRHRPTFDGDDEASIPYDTKGWQADLPLEKFVRGY
jgi:hypothetical protein